MKKLLTMSLVLLLLVGVLPTYVNAEADTTIKIKYYEDTYEVKVDVLKLANLFSDFEESHPEENNKITVKVNQSELKTDINGLKLLLNETNTDESKEIWKEISKKQRKREFYRILSTFSLIPMPPQILEILYT